MLKVKTVHFIEHSVLGNLQISFANSDKRAADTVIIAGENGSGKSTLLDCLYKVASRKVDFDVDIEFENETDCFTIKYRSKEMGDGSRLIYASDGTGMNTWVGSPDMQNKYPTSGIFSDVDINFHSENISSVTSLTLDEKSGSRRSSNRLSTEVNQLIIDIQALDDAEVARAVRANPELKVEELNVNERMPRFTQAFSKVFDNLEYSHIDNIKGKKTIVFNKNDIEIPIEKLSSGEKQIIYRGCFLLKDINAIKGEFVFIDEPEISLHPKWQEKILDYYKSIFTDMHGAQSSQLFVATHSPFIVHNKYRRNDKVIVLERDTRGVISVKDRPEYYKCDGIETVQDAFSIQGFNSAESTVYLEGKTDEIYFLKTLSVFNINPPFRFKWIGYIENGQERNTGKDALNKAFDFLVASDTVGMNVCLFDCDTNKTQKNIGNTFLRVLQTYKNSKNMKKGIENALVLDDIDIKDSFYTTKEKVGDYGDVSTIKVFDKVAFCNYICGMDDNTLKTVFANLHKEVLSLLSLFEQNTNQEKTGIG